ncbi:MAG: hypothetical protein VZR00_09290 [Lachnospiraceae bacterium]|nr:hypothetical protein [Lachnospiraceae bacterium]MEE3462061.1 hypothetical protein [Lachnospiraceae bacterium]
MDGETKVRDAVSFVEDKFNKNLSQYENNKFTYKVQHLYVIKNPENDCYDFNMVIGRIYRDIPIDTCSDFLISPGKCYDKVHCGSHMMVIMRHKNKLDYVNIMTELFETESEEKEEKIISPLWAVNRIKETIAHVNGMSFVQCGLVYLITQKNELASKNEQDVLQEVNDTTYLRPVWLFSTKRSENAIYGTRTKDGHGASVIVDALDGSLYYYEDTGGY